jgi:eukaryotic-like serine/threonine-protein kinase
VNARAVDVLCERYELGPTIGRGGMAEVRRAHDRRLGRDVAIKLLRPELSCQPDVRARFEEEARSAARLAHPNVVTVFDTGETDGAPGRPFIVMECLPGRTLADDLKRGPLSEHDVREVGVAIAGALDAAHRVGIVHRDVKPGNVLFADDGTPKIADFGIAKSADSLDPTRTGLVLGTPAYIAPERLTGEAATPATDLYSLGVVLYEAITGRRPFVHDTPIELAHAIRTQTPPAIADLRPSCDPALARAIEQAIAREPTERFGSAGDMRAALLVDDMTDATVPIDVTRTMQVTPIPTQTIETNRARRRRFGSPMRVVAPLAIAAFAVLAAAFVLADDDGGGVAPPAASVTSTPANDLPAPLRDALDDLDRAVTP